MSNAAAPPDGLVVLVVEIEEPEHGDRPRTGSAVSGLRFGLFVGLSLAIDLTTPEGARARVPVR